MSSIRAALLIAVTIPLLCGCPPKEPEDASKAEVGAAVKEAVNADREGWARDIGQGLTPMIGRKVGFGQEMTEEDLQTLVALAQGFLDHQQKRIRAFRFLVVQDGRQRTVATVWGKGKDYATGPKARFPTDLVISTKMVKTTTTFTSGGDDPGVKVEVEVYYTPR